MPARMTAVDAQFYWMSAKVPSDEFLLYAFAAVPTDFERAVDEVPQPRPRLPSLDHPRRRRLAADLPELGAHSP